MTEIAEHLGVTAKTLHEWVRLHRPPAPDRLTGDERTEPSRRSTRRWPTRHAAATEDNPIRLQSTLGYHAPAQFEAPVHRNHPVHETD